MIDGRNGAPLLDRAVKSSVGAQSSPLTISVDGHGNDVFIYWNADCSLHEGEGGEFDFVKGIAWMCIFSTAKEQSQVMLKSSALDQTSVS